jgi:hypothetical protein
MHFVSPKCVGKIYKLCRQKLMYVPKPTPIFGVLNRLPSRESNYSLTNFGLLELKVTYGSTISMQKILKVCQYCPTGQKHKKLMRMVLLKLFTVKQNSIKSSHVWQNVQKLINVR